LKETSSCTVDKFINNVHQLEAHRTACVGGNCHCHVNLNSSSHANFITEIHQNATTLRVRGNRKTIAPSGLVPRIIVLSGIYGEQRYIAVVILFVMPFFPQTFLLRSPAFTDLYPLLFEVEGGHYFAYITCR